MQDVMAVIRGRESESKLLFPERFPKDLMATIRDEVLLLIWKRALSISDDRRLEILVSRYWSSHLYRLRDCPKESCAGKFGCVTPTADMSKRTFQSTSIKTCHVEIIERIHALRKRQPNASTICADELVKYPL